MSPEQAQGKHVDARSDIFSFGSVLYEMVTGRRAFQGDSKMSTLAAIIDRDPAPLPAEIPHDLEKLITRCLRKDPARRFQTMADLKVALEELKEESDSGKLAGATGPQPRATRRKPLLVGSGLLAIVSAVVLVWHFPQSRPQAPFKAVPLTGYPGLESEPSLSPDGNSVAFVWNGEKQDNFDIYVASLDGGSPLRLTMDAARDFDPAWSPDGGKIAFMRELGGGQAGLYLVPPLRGTERRLVTVLKQRPGQLRRDHTRLGVRRDSVAGAV